MSLATDSGSQRPRPLREAVLVGPRQFELREVADPAPGPGDALVAVRACGVCGSDLPHFADLSDASTGVVLGHEFAGEVLAIGSDVRRVGVGDRVVVIPLASCGSCESCRAGRTNTCQTATARGANGAFADAVLVADADFRAVPLPTDLGYDEAAIVEPLATAVHAVGAVRPRPDAPVVVLGLGTIGLLLVQVLRARGVQRVVAVDRHAFRIEAARTAGATDVVQGAVADAEEALISLLGTRTGPFSSGSTAGAVFDCTASQEALDVAVRLVAPGGTVALVGLYGTTPLVDAGRLVTKDVTLRGCFAYTRDDFIEALELASGRSIRLRPLISHTFPLDQLTEAFTTQLRKDHSLKVIVTP